MFELVPNSLGIWIFLLVVPLTRWTDLQWQGSLRHPALLPPLCAFSRRQFHIPCCSPCLQDPSNLSSPLTLTPGLLLLALNFMVSTPCSRALAKALPLEMSPPHPAPPASLPSIFCPGTWLKAPVSSHSFLPSSNLYPIGVTLHISLPSSAHLFIHPADVIEFLLKCSGTVIGIGDIKKWTGKDLWPWGTHISDLSTAGAEVGLERVNRHVNRQNKETM